MSIGLNANNDGTGSIQIGGSDAINISTGLNVGIGTASPTAPLDVNGNVAITGSARRITGDFSNATAANRVAFQSSTTNGNTAIPFIPNGTATTSAILLYGGTDTANTNITQVFSTGVIATAISGTGTYQPMQFYTGGSERMRIDTSGNVGIGITSTNGYWGSTVTDAKVNIAYSSSGTTFDTAIKGLVLQNTNTTTNNTTSLIFGSQNTSGTGIAQAAIYSINGTRGAGFNSGQLGFSYANSSGVLTEAMRIDSSGNVLVTSAAGLGYGTGSGGTVTQTTNKSTAVTLNKPTGAITTSNAALAANTWVTFTVNNTLVAAADIVMVMSTNGNYLAKASNTGAGSFSIDLLNRTGGSLSDAVQINFAIIKGATS